MFGMDVFIGGIVRMCKKFFTPLRVMLLFLFAMIAVVNFAANLNVSSLKCDSPDEQASGVIIDKSAVKRHAMRLPASGPGSFSVPMDIPLSHHAVSLLSDEPIDMSKALWGVSYQPSSVQTATFSLPRFLPEASASGGKANLLDVDLSEYAIQGVTLLRKQFERGLRKTKVRTSRRDQSFQGLRDIIEDSSDPAIKEFLAVVNALEKEMDTADSNNPRTYMRDLIHDLTPIASFIEEKSGIPASVIIAQVAIESGWGMSNITILKNNILGLGNSSSPKSFQVTLKMDDYSKVIDVRCMKDTTAFSFENIGDSIFYYVYVLIQSPGNAVHYADLRKYIGENRSRTDISRKQYRDRVIALIAESYHSDPAWYIDMLKGLISRVEEFGGQKLLASSIR